MRLKKSTSIRFLLKIPVVSASKTRLLLILSMTALIAACGGTRDRGLEQRINDALVSRKADGSTSLDLSPYLREPNAQICIQGPYLEEDQFEKFVGKDVTGFEYLGGKGYGLWFLYPDGSATWVLIETRTMGHFPNKGKPCIQASGKPELGLAFDNGIRKFYLTGA